MQKKLIALAVAGLASTAAFAQSNVTIYGTLNPSYDYMDMSDEDGSRASMQSNNSNIGFKGEENLGNGLKAIFQIESGVGIGGHRSDDAPQDGVLGGRNTFVGLKGGFGEVTIGRRDTAYKSISASYDPFADTIGDYNNIIGLSSMGDFNRRANSSINYISPSWSGFKVMAAYALQDQNATTGQDDNLFSLGASYDMGGLNLMAGYEIQKGSASAGDSDVEAWKIGAKYNFGAASIFGLYEEIEQTNGDNIGRDAWYIGGTYKIGAVDLLATYADADSEKGTGAGVNSGADNWNIGARYNLSKRTNVMAIYTDLSNKGNTTDGGTYFIDSNGVGDGETGRKIDGFSVRVQHKF